MSFACLRAYMSFKLIIRTCSTRTSCHSFFTDVFRTHDGRRPVAAFARSFVHFAAKPQRCAPLRRRPMETKRARYRPSTDFYPSFPSLFIPMWLAVARTSFLVRRRVIKKKLKHFGASLPTLLPPIRRLGRHYYCTAAASAAAVAQTRTHCSTAGRRTFSRFSTSQHACAYVVATEDAHNRLAVWRLARTHKSRVPVPLAADHA